MGRNFVGDGKENCRNYMLLHNSIPNASATLIQKEAFERCGGPPLDWKLNGDWLFYCRLLQHGDIAYSAAPLNRFRKHQKTQRQRANANARAYFEILDIVAFIDTHCSPETEKRKHAFHNYSNWWIGSLFRQERNLRYLKDNGVLYRRFQKNVRTSGLHRVHGCTEQPDPVARLAEDQAGAQEDPEGLVSRQVFRARMSTPIVLIPCLNCSSFLRASLRSVREQSLPPLEVLLVDDGVRMRVQRAQELLDGASFPMHIIRQENRGLGAARNVGIQQAQESDRLSMQTISGRPIIERMGAQGRRYGRGPPFDARSWRGRDEGHLRQAVGRCLAARPGPIPSASLIQPRS